MRPVRLVVGYAAGGGTDIIARLVGQSLSERLGQQFVVEGRLGAASNIATELVVRAAPDGYTLLAANAADATLYEKLNFNHDTRGSAIATFSARSGTPSLRRIGFAIFGDGKGRDLAYSGSISG